MPSALPKIVVRASQERIEAWQQAAGADSMNAWAGRILDAAAGLGVLPQSAPPTASGNRLSDPCSRQRHHRLGVFCKECGAS